MATGVFPLKLTRNTLAEITKNNPEAIKQLENLFAVVNDTASLDILNAALAAENGLSLANLALGLVKQVEQTAALAALSPAVVNDTASLDILNAALAAESGISLANLALGLVKQVEQTAALAALSPAVVNDTASLDILNAAVAALSPAVVNDTASLDMLNAALAAESGVSLANLALGLVKQVEQTAALAALAPAVVVPNLVRPGRAGYAGDGVTAAFALPEIWAASNDPEDFDVTIDGASQDTTAYSVIAGTITFVSAPAYCPPSYSSIIVRSRR